jgi:hypothetical protein
MIKNPHLLEIIKKIKILKIKDKMKDQEIEKTVIRKNLKNYLIKKLQFSNNKVLHLLLKIKRILNKIKMAN